MVLATDEIGLSEVTLTHQDVWRIIRDKFYDDDDVIVQGASKKQVFGRLNYTKTVHFGREIYSRIDSEPLCDGRNNPGLKFSQFYFTYYEEKALHRVIGCAHPHLVDHVYLPAFYVLTTRKSTDVYEHLLHFVFIATKRKVLAPISLVEGNVVFELAHGSKSSSRSGGMYLVCVNRTNNPLERYNRSLNEAFSVAHPDITQFIGVIDEQSRENVRLLADILNRRARAPNHAPAHAPSSLEPDSDSDSDTVEFEGSEIENSSCTSSIASVSPKY
ncbi:unnamed protein product [Phytophthora fragariaefolia]|uniref:Unnamed protein product n=1 Tax=Phytophthora fragariaefolia TaxID=1490495 RepID=A0A9W6Y214_9STRA|nr:unnamed protein product [Phytophthora fragariaefolia]